MPPDPKRKRGRPSNASKPPTASQARRPEEYEADAEEDTRPRKRGRPRKSLDDAPEEARTEEPRKRGRPSLGGRAEAEAVEDEQPMKRKRGRPSSEKQREGAVTDDEAQKRPHKKGNRGGRQLEAGEEAQPEELQHPQKRARKSRLAEIEEAEASEPTAKSRRRRKPANASEEHEDNSHPAPKSKRGRKPPHPAEEDPDAGLPKRKRGRPSLNVEQAQEKEDQPEKPRRKGRPSLQDLPPDDAQNKVAHGKKFRKGRVSTSLEEAEQSDATSRKKRSRISSGRPSINRNEPPEEDASTRRASQANTQEPPTSPAKPYLHIAPKTKRIRPSTITSKWAPLSGPSLPAATAILHLAHRPILQRMSHTRQRREHASVALRLITHRISKKLSKGLPFPPASVAPASRMSTKSGEGDGGRETELDFEAVLDARAALERQLGPGLHAVELLRKERERMEAELERDYEALRGLEASARGQARERRELLKKAHVLAPTSRSIIDHDDDIKKEDAASESLFKNLDETLNPLALQLAGHVESIRTNLQQADGIVPHIRHSRAALQGVLFRYLDKGAYEQVVLGLN